MRGSFGLLLFELAQTPSAFSVKQSTNYAPHPRIEDKPVLQWTSHELDVIKFTMRFHGLTPSPGRDYTDPELEVSMLQQMLLEHNPYPLIMIEGGAGTINGTPYSGLGVFEKEYVLESIDSVVRRFDKAGRIFCIDVDCQLLECVLDTVSNAGRDELAGGGNPRNRDNRRTVPQTRAVSGLIGLLRSL